MSHMLPLRNAAWDKCPTAVSHTRYGMSLSVTGWSWRGSVTRWRGTPVTQ